MKFAVSTAAEFVDVWATLSTTQRQPLSDLNGSGHTPSRYTPSRRLPVVNDIPTAIQVSPPAAVPEESPSRRNCRGNENGDDPKAKRLKFIPQSIDEMIEKCKQGKLSHI